MTPKKSVVRWKTALVAAGVAAVALLSASSRMVSAQTSSATALSYADQLIQEGRKAFRDDTFGDEAFWGGQLRLHQAIAGAANGGVGPGVSPETALAVGLKVDLDRLPPALVLALKLGQVNLKDPATTITLLKLNAVVGVRGFFDPSTGRIAAMGIQCALCHSTVDNALTAGIGRRLDGWPNRDLNVGAIVALAPNLSPFTTLLGVERRHRALGAQELGSGQVRRRADPRRQGLPPRRQDRRRRCCRPPSGSRE